jgi:hypothetical protein
LLELEFPELELLPELVLPVPEPLPDVVDPPVAGGDTIGDGGFGPANVPWNTPSCEGFEPAIRPMSVPPTGAGFVPANVPWNTPSCEGFEPAIRPMSVPPTGAGFVPGRGPMMGPMPAVGFVPTIVP